MFLDRTKKRSMKHYFEKAPTEDKKSDGGLEEELEPVAELDEGLDMFFKL